VGGRQVVKSSSRQVVWDECVRRFIARIERGIHAENLEGAEDRIFFTSLCVL